MKKNLILVVLFLLVCLSSFGQIQRKFFGFIFGISTKTEVVSYFKTNKIPYIIEDASTIKARNIKFAGKDWPFAVFLFYNNRFFEAYFANSSDYTSQTTMELIWGNIKESLIDKYSQYTDKNYTTNNKKSFDDGKTILNAEYTHMDRTSYISLMYYDIHLFDAYNKKNKDEL